MSCVGGRRSKKFSSTATLARQALLSSLPCGVGERSQQAKRRDGYHNLFPRRRRGGCSVRLCSDCGCLPPSVAYKSGGRHAKIVALHGACACAEEQQRSVSVDWTISLFLFFFFFYLLLLLSNCLHLLGLRRVGGLLNSCCVSSVSLSAHYHCPESLSLFLSSVSSLLQSTSY